ncbi:DUF3299 domain-containing protein [Colwelliaceae bacterium BS250]
MFSIQRFFTVIFLVATFFSANSYAKDSDKTANNTDVKSIHWGTLNEHVKPKILDNPFAALNIDQIRLLQQVAVVEDLKITGDTLDEQSIELANSAKKQLTEQGVDVESLFKQREMIINQRKMEFESTNPALENANIEMAGFLLPLEFDGKKVTEFLLVPYVGACIHEPPPAANQIIYAKLQTPIEMPSSGMFTPVKVKGLMTSALVQPELNLVDGSKPIPTSYSLSVDNIEFDENN